MSIVRMQFRFSLSAGSFAIICILSVAILVNLWLLSNRAAEDVATRRFQNVATDVSSEFVRLIEQASKTAVIIAASADLDNADEIAFLKSVTGLLSATLSAHPDLYSIYLGFEDRSFLQVIAARGNARIIAAHKAPPQTAWIYRAIYNDESGRRLQQWRFLDVQKHLIGQRLEQEPDYDPLKRPWYQKAQDGPGQSQLSQVYMFNSLQQPGITASKRLLSGVGVVGVDLTLSHLGQFVTSAPVSDNGYAFIYDAEYRAVALPQAFERYPALSDLRDIPHPSLAAIFSNSEQGFHKAEIEGEEYFANILSTDGSDSAFFIAIAAPLSDFSQTFALLQKRIVLMTVICLLLFIPLVYWFSLRISQRLTLLVNDAKKLEQLDFAIEERDASYVREFEELELGFSRMRNSLSEKTTALALSQAKLNRLVEIGIATSAQKNHNRVLRMALEGAMELSCADAAALYILEGQKLVCRMAHSAEGVDDQLLDKGILYPDLSLYTDQGEEDLSNVTVRTVHQNASINIANAKEYSECDASQIVAAGELFGCDIRSVLVIPMIPRGGSAIGVLQVLNAKTADASRVIVFTKEIQRLVEALSALAATVAYNRHLLQSQENLMDAMIQILAGAIDAKSPYTGGHCERVPELAAMLVRAASDEEEGAFADFSFNSDEEWREFKIGAWLHDCGKVVTPEYVVDKATKLETIYNRIHEIRTRFEVLLRDAELEKLRSLAAGVSADQADAAFMQKKVQLLEDFEFVANCNVGSEFMEPEAQERLEVIAARTWVRNFDIKSGLSHEELTLYQGAEAAPVTEKLLDDKSYHLIERKRDIKEQYCDFGFKNTIPQYLYNRGELYNLSVVRGTLTEEERFKINEHIMQTIAMLEKMPFPAHLKRVPEYAGTHHETMIGTGYPRKLSAEDLSIPARVMAIADIFEALTASDRPYKTAKTLSESIRILSFFKKDQHIDGELFDLFLRSGIYLEYAKRYLAPEQIDEVDISQYLN